MALLELRNLSVEFPTPDGVVRGVDRLSFSIERGETLGLVGESGSGKSVTALSILQLLDPPGRVGEGEILLDGEQLLEKTEREMLHIRGKRIAMIFQEPSTSLNPILNIGGQILEALKTETYDAWRAGAVRGLLRWVWDRLRRDKRYDRDKLGAACDLLGEVRIPSAQATLRRYPYMLSGGMMQRVMIAIAIASQPGLLIADEPTTALDVTIQAQIIDILRERRDASNLTMLLITHDLGLIAELCDRVVVLYAGQSMELAPVEDLFDTPLHPYTRGLLASIPSLDLPIETLKAIDGAVPNVIGLPRTACHFAWNDRCPLQTDICRNERPPMVEKAPGHYVACHVYSHPAMQQLLDRLRSEVWVPLPVAMPGAP